MGDENGKTGEKFSGILDDIRKTESPGRSGGEFPYARAVYAYFPEIQGLMEEGFTLATICKFLVKKGVLPAGADTHSFCRAFRREKARRERAKPKERKMKGGTANKDNATKSATASNARLEPVNLPPQPPAPVNPEGRLQVNPDNTFVIRPIDPSLLPDYDELTKRRSGV
jgi:hypothetical protein